MEPNDAGGDADQHNDEEHKPLMGGETDEAWAAAEEEAWAAARAEVKAAAAARAATAAWEAARAKWWKAWDAYQQAAKAKAQENAK